MTAGRTLLPALAAGVLALAACGKPGPGVTRTAVLPFENLTPDSSLDWMGRGVAEALADQLSSAPQAQFLVATERAQAAAIGAGRFISGYYSQVDGKLRLSAWVQNGPSGTIERVATAEGEASAGILPLSDSVARALEPAAQSFATRDQAAFRAFVEGRQARDPEAAAQAFERAVSLDAGFGLAYISWVQSAVARQDRPQAQRVLDMARSAGNRLRDIDRARLELDEAVLRNDAAGRVRVLKSLAALRPADAGVWRSLGDTELSAHHASEAAGFYRKAAALDPGNGTALNTLGYAEALAGNLDAAVEALRRYQRLEPDQANPLDSLGDVYFRFGRLAEAEKHYRESFEKAPAGVATLSLEKAARARLMTGDVAGADTLFHEYLQARQRQGDAAAGYRRAQWLYLSGRREQGIQAMEAQARQKRIPALAAQADAQLAVWYLERGDRAAARQSAEAAGPVALGDVVRFITEPPASASECAVRAERAFPEPARERMKQFALGYALLFSRDFAAAAPLWRQIYLRSNPLSPEGADVLLAWTYIESDRWDGVDDLVKTNPFPRAAGPTPFASLAFPRIFDLRARLFEKQGKTREAARNRRLFKLLSGQGGFQPARNS